MTAQLRGLVTVCVCVYLLLMSLLAFCLMGLDKHKARRSAWRVPEKVLFAAALLGGGMGAAVGMRVFHHKTQHWYFRFGLPAIMAVQLAGLVCVALWALGVFG